VMWSLERLVHAISPSVAIRENLHNRNSTSILPHA
jgi:hypothetical protein